jgi:hypothetical protein
MMARDDALAIGRATAQALDAYVFVHDAIFGVAWYRAIRRIIPIPGVFDRIPYDEHHDTLERIRGDLQRTSQQAQALLQGKPLDEATANFLLVRERYTAALLDAIRHLTQLCQEMAQKAEGRPGPAWSAYRNSLREYEESQRNYIRLGSDMNAAFSALRRTPG